MKPSHHKEDSMALLMNESMELSRLPRTEKKNSEQKKSFVVFNESRMAFSEFK